MKDARLEVLPMPRPIPPRRVGLLVLLVTAVSLPAAADGPPRPLLVEQIEELEFGRLSVARGHTGVVTVLPDGGKEVAGAADLGGFHAAAVFLVAGEPGRRFTISLPEEVSLEGRTLGEARISDFRSLPQETGTLDAGGRASVRLGASLRVPDGASGRFREAFRIHVAYEDQGEDGSQEEDGTQEEYGTEWAGGKP